MLQLIKNTDTLAKSKKDAEDERKERASELSSREFGANRKRKRNEDDIILNNIVQADIRKEDELLSSEDYLLYANPYITRSNIHNFVRGALFAGRVNGVLPTTIRDTIFFRQSNANTDVNNCSVNIHHPLRMTESVANALDNQIRREVRAKRERRQHSEQQIPDNQTILETFQTPNDIYIRIASDSNKLRRLIEQVQNEFNLNEAQARCYNLFVRNLIPEGAQSKAIVETNSRTMYVGGSGGTGKTRVIKAITAIFERAGCREKLRLSATTGVAANLVVGSTIDSLCQFRRKLDEGDECVADDLLYLDVDNTWIQCQFLIIDEMSMLGFSKLAKISSTLSRMKSCKLPFGGLFVLFSGDFHQLPPVKDRCLYHQPNPHGSRLHQNGFFLWREVTKKTVLLTEHYRARNPKVYKVLDRIRCGQATQHDIELLQQRTFGHARGPDQSNPKWQSAPLITPRNTVRHAWNNYASLRHTATTGNQIFISPAIDEGCPLSRNQMVWSCDSDTGMLATWSVICMDAVSIVTANVAVELGVANGSRVVVKEVVPHPDDHQGWSRINDAIVKLSQPPLCVYVEVLEEESDIGEYYPGKPGWFPIMRKKAIVKTPKEFGTPVSFSRTQIPLTPAFAMSDYRVQGRGLNTFIVDLQRPPTGSLKLENIYVMLSRASNWEDISILRRFDESIFQAKADETLMEYDKYLQSQNEATKAQYKGNVGS